MTLHRLVLVTLAPLVALVFAAGVLFLRAIGSPCAGCRQPLIDCRCPDPFDDDETADAAHAGGAA